MAEVGVHPLVPALAKVSDHPVNKDRIDVRRSCFGGRASRRAHLGHLSSAHSAPKSSWSLFRAGDCEVRAIVPGQNEITGKNGDWIQGAVQLTQKRNAISAPSLLLKEIRARFISLKYNIALRQVRRDA
jgi:hypothetical protein